MKNAPCERSNGWLSQRDKHLCHANLMAAEAKGRSFADLAETGEVFAVDSETLLPWLSKE